MARTLVRAVQRADDPVPTPRSHPTPRLDGLGQPLPVAGRFKRLHRRSLVAAGPLGLRDTAESETCEQPALSRLICSNCSTLDPTPPCARSALAMSANRQATVGRWLEFPPSQWGRFRPSFSLAPAGRPPGRYRAPPYDLTAFSRGPSAPVLIVASTASAVQWSATAAKRNENDAWMRSRPERQGGCDSRIASICSRVSAGWTSRFGDAGAGLIAVRRPLT
jgi:hypothetical protein